MDIIFLTEDSKINHIRHLRDELLKSSDKYMLSDYPITEEKRQEWKDYRALLRDIPNTIKIRDSRGLGCQSLVQYVIPIAWDNKVS